MFPSNRQKQNSGIVYIFKVQSSHISQMSAHEEGNVWQLRDSERFSQSEAMWKGLVCQAIQIALCLIKFEPALNIG